jgi:hypothetical protein
VLFSKRTTHFTIKTINWLTLFKEIIAVYSKKLTNPYTKNVGLLIVKANNLGPAITEAYTMYQREFLLLKFGK